MPTSFQNIGRGEIIFFLNEKHITSWSNRCWIFAARLIDIVLRRATTSTTASGPRHHASLLTSKKFLRLPYSGVVRLAHGALSGGPPRRCGRLLVEDGFQGLFLLFPFFRKHGANCRGHLDEFGKPAQEKWRQIVLLIFLYGRKYFFSTSTQIIISSCFQIRR